MCFFCVSAGFVVVVFCNSTEMADAEFDIDALLEEPINKQRSSQSLEVSHVETFFK
jgi:hypothetical protein